MLTLSARGANPTNEVNLITLLYSSVGYLLSPSYLIPPPTVEELSVGVMPSHRLTRNRLEQSNWFINSNTNSKANKTRRGLFGKDLRFNILSLANNFSPKRDYV